MKPKKEKKRKRIQFDLNDANECEWFTSSLCRFTVMRLRNLRKKMKKKIEKKIKFDLKNANECEWFSNSLCTFPAMRLRNCSEKKWKKIQNKNKNFEKKNPIRFEWC